MASTTLAPPRALPARLHPLAGVAAWALLIVVAHRSGARLQADDPRVHIGAPPLVGRYAVAGGPWLLAAAAFAAGAVAYAPVLAARLTWRRLLVAAWAGAAAWAVLLALGDGPHALGAPLTTRYEYLAVLDRVGSPGAFLGGFVDHLASYPTHVKGHPPGIVLLFWALQQVGLGGPSIAAIVVIAAGALAAPATLVTVRAVAGEQSARRGAPLLALAPAAVWVATSADALILGLSTCGIACVALGAGGRDRAALAGGLLLGLALSCSYGVAPLGAVVLALAATAPARAPRVLVLVGAGVLAVLAAFAAAGFWWPAGLHATHGLYAAGVASRRPYADFLLIAPAAFALALGPAAAAGLTRVAPPLRLLVLGGVVAVAGADLSGLSRGENERIWLLFTPWILCATVALGARRRWLAAQLALGLALQVGVRSPW